MTARTRYFWLLGWALVLGLKVAPSRAAGADTLRLSYKDSGLFGRYFTACFDAPSEAPGGQRAVALWEAGRFRPQLSPFGVLQGGYRQERLWLRATVVNALPQRTRFVWSLYEFVDSATLYVQPPGGIPVAVSGASSRVVASRRPFPARAVCLPFWLGANERAVLYLRVENRTGAWCLPTDIATVEGFLRFEDTYLVYTHWVWLLGFYLGSGLFNIVLYGFLRDRIHLWYCGYVLFSTWFLLMEDSLDALMLPQGLYWLGWQFSEFGVLLLALACGLRIMALFVRLEQGWPRLHRLSWGLSVLAASYALAYPWLFGVVQRAGSAALVWLNGGRDALLWALLLAGAGLLGSVVWRGRAAQRRLAALYAVAYVFFFCGSVELLLNYSGLVYLVSIEPNILAWGLAIELLMVNILLTGRFRHALRQNTALRLRQLGERAAAGERLIRAQDDEREALARELHDALAPGLTALHLAWQGRQVRQALAQGPPLLAEAHHRAEALLRQLRNDVRDLSHVLLPNAPGEQLPLPQAVALLTETLSLADDGPRVLSHCDPAAAHLPTALRQAAYRIVAELLHNALRHAQARQVRVELTHTAPWLIIVVADDGRGFTAAPHAPYPVRGGLGLRGVQARAAYLRGRVQVVSQVGHGTTITVELPL